MISAQTIDIFGNETFLKETPSPAQRILINTKARAEKLRLKIEARKAAFKPFVWEKSNISQFAAPEIGSQFIGQNIYIKPNYIVSMPEYAFFNRETGEIMDKNPRTMTEAFIENQKNLLDNDSKGKLSKKAVSGLRNCINWLCIAAKPKKVFNKAKNTTFNFKVNFITLTLPDTETPVASDLFQKQLLNPFLVYMRKYHSLKNYVWRLEFQANGKLHVHLTTDTFLHLKRIRETWNRLLKKNGYLVMYNKMLLDQNKGKDIESIKGYNDPNSTDVHATKKIKNLAGYLAKYMSKKNSTYTISAKKRKAPFKPLDRKAAYFQRLNFWNSSFNPRPIKGRVWSCNRELSAANKCQVHIPAPECREQMASLMKPSIQYKEIMSKPNERTLHLYGADSVFSTPKKIGELFFIKAKSWYGEITGVIKDTFANTRNNVAALTANYTTFELN